MQVQNNSSAVNSSSSLPVDAQSAISNLSNQVSSLNGVNAETLQALIALLQQLIEQLGQGGGQGGGGEGGGGGGEGGGGGGIMSPVPPPDAGETIDGTSGDDSINGGDLNDVISGGAGNDTINGGAGNDLLDGNAGNDTINGGEGQDFIEGGTGDDALDGGAAADQLAGGAGNDTLNGQAGDDALNGDEGDDQISGGDGDDFINGGPGSDTLTGGAGSDTFLINGRENSSGQVEFEGVDTITDFQSGEDRINVTAFLNDPAPPGSIPVERSDLQYNQDTGELFANTGNGFELVANLGAGTELTQSDLVDDFGQVNNLELLSGGAGGGGSTNSLVGTDGNDTIVGTDGDDDIRGRRGDDSLTGGAGNDTIRGGRGADIIDGQDGNDSLRGGRGNDSVNGGAGNDTLNGNAGDDFLLGGEGDDRILGGFGNDTIEGGLGNDTLSGNAGNDNFVIGGTVRVGENADFGGVDTITDFTSGEDTLEVTTIPTADPGEPVNPVINVPDLQYNQNTGELFALSENGNAQLIANLGAGTQLEASDLRFGNSLEFIDGNPTPPPSTSDDIEEVPLSEFDESTAQSVDQNIPVAGMIGVSDGPSPELSGEHVISNAEQLNDFISSLSDDPTFSLNQEIDFENQVLIISSRDVNDPNSRNYSTEVDGNGNLQVNVLSTLVGFNPAGVDEYEVLIVDRSDFEQLATSNPLNDEPLV